MFQWILAITIGGMVLKWRARTSVKKLPPPKETGTYTKKDIREILEKHLNLDCIIQIDDTTKAKYTFDDFLKFVRNDDTNFKEYIKDRNDCEDFTHRFLALLQEYMPGAAAGEMITDNGRVYHSQVIFIDNYGKISVLEPQTDFIGLINVRNDVVRVRM